MISSLRVPAVIDTAERRPAQLLRPCISRYAGFRIEGVAPGVTHGLPSRHVTLMIGLGAPFNIAHAGSFTSFVSGLHDTPALVERGRAIKGLHLFLTPLGTRSLLGVPASALAGHVVDLGDVIGTSADELQDRLRGAASWPRRFDILDDVFARALEERPTSREIGWAWRTLISEAGRTRIEDVANEIEPAKGLGERSGWPLHQLLAEGLHGAEPPVPNNLAPPNLGLQPTASDGIMSRRG